MATIKARDSITIASNSVGGRNFYLNTGLTRGTTGLAWWQRTPTTHSDEIVSDAATKSGKARKITYTEAGREGPYWTGHHLNRKTFEKGKCYTQSCMMKASTDLTVSWGCEGLSKKENNVATSWQKFSFTVKATDSNSMSVAASFYPIDPGSIHGDLEAGTILYIADYKMEEGSIATDWTPAPEDVDSAISTAQSTADAAKKKLYHSASGTNGTAGYVGFCTIKVKQNYANMPILFTLQNRGGQSTNLSVCFNNVNGTDPGLLHFQRDGGVNVWAYKSTASTWILIARKSEAYDEIYVTDYSNPWESRFTVTWTNTHYSSLPAPNITAATLLAGKINKSVVDDAAKTATNYLYQDRTNGLVVGYKDGSGNWAAARSQMKSDGFYVIRKDGTEVGHFKDSEVLIGQSSGRNVLIDNDSVDIRNGSKVLSSFTSDAIYLGKNSDSSVIDISNNAGTLRGSIDSNNKKKFNILSENEIHIKTSDNLVIDCMHASEIHSRIDMQSRSPSIMNLYSTTPGGMSMVSIGDTSIDISSTYNATNKECNIELNEGNININGQTTINSPASVLIGGSNDYTYSLRLGDTYTKACSINTVWADGNVHDLISRASNGISSYYGPASFSDKHTTTNIRGYTVRLYNHGGGTYLGSSGSTAITSDRNLKRDIYDVDDKYIDFFSKLRPVSYKYNAKENIGHRDHIGYIAQEVEEALLSSGLTTEQFAGICIENDVDLDFNYDSSLTEEEIEANKVHYDKLYSLRYEEFIALNTHMIQKCLSKIEDTQKEIDELKATISDLTSKINNKEE